MPLTALNMLLDSAWTNLLLRRIYTSISMQEGSADIQSTTEESNQPWNQSYSVPDSLGAVNQHPMLTNKAAASFTSASLLINVDCLRTNQAVWGPH